MTDKPTRTEPEQDLIAGMLVRSHSEHCYGWRKKRPKRPRRREQQTIAWRLGRLPGIRWDLLLPIRLGYDYVGGLVAALLVVTVGVTLILLIVLRH